MSGSGRITLVAACSEPQTDRDVVRLETDYAGSRRNAVYILPREPLPVEGDTIEWTTANVIWHHAAGDTTMLRKIGYAFDPYPEFSNGMQQI